ncbi:MAG: stress response protein [Chloroflexi bacterium]|nr:stress response protein [Chloroflexota bacterium]
MNEETWLRARLIPISGIGGQEEKERRATSALLAVLGAVKEFGRATLGRLGAPAGTVSTYCEVPFELNDGQKVRVDGLIRVQRGKRVWTLLVEVKTGTNELSQQQVESYLEVVREHNFDGLLTISNQIVPVVDHHPVKVDGRKFGRVPLFHISWTRILTLAYMVKEHQGVSDPDQAWILGELIRYLEYEGSGALAFEDMGPYWVAVRTAAREQTLRLSDEGVEEVAARWDQLIQYLCLGLGARLGQEVRPVLSRKETEDPDARTVAVARDLAQTGTLSADIRIPNTVGPIHLTANLRTMRAAASTEMAAPEVRRPATGVSWLLRQLRNAPPELRIDVAFFRTRSTSSELLERVMEDPKLVLTEHDRVPRSFELTLSSGVGTKRKSGQGSFIGDVSALLDRFYRDVVQDLKAWAPPAPQLRPAKSAPTQPEADPSQWEGSLPDTNGQERRDE